MDKTMSPIEFKAGMMQLANSQPYSPAEDVFIAWNMVFAYMDLDDDAKRACSEMLRLDLEALDTDTVSEERAHTVARNGRGPVYCEKCR
ncbi:hypothetical protein LCGC14_2953650, partial [marine sediment metagenome]